MNRASSVINFFLGEFKIRPGPELIARLKDDFLSFAFSLLHFFDAAKKLSNE